MWVLTSGYTCVAFTTIKTEIISIILKSSLESFSTSVPTSQYPDGTTTRMLCHPGLWTSDLSLSVSLSFLVPLSLLLLSSYHEDLIQSSYLSRNLLQFSSPFGSVLFSATLNNCSISSAACLPGALPGFCQSNQDFYWVRPSSFQRGINQPGSETPDSLPYWIWENVFLESRVLNVV